MRSFAAPIVPVIASLATALISAGATAESVHIALDGTVHPNDLGWTYVVLGNGLSGTEAFTLGKGVIKQQTLGAGFAGQGGNYWGTVVEVPHASPWILKARIRVIGSEIWSFPFGSYAAFGNAGFGVMMNSVSPLAAGSWTTLAFDAMQWHDYRFESTACGRWSLFIDGTLIAEGLGALTEGSLELAFGDGTGGANANTEFDSIELTVNLGIGADFNMDGVVDAQDLAILLGAWGQPGVTDLNCSGSTEAGDLAVLLGAWG
jgi:hypothetical protein